MTYVRVMHRKRNRNKDRIAHVRSTLGKATNVGDPNNRGQKGGGGKGSK